MGYRCPVCEDPQADAGHLANHLALTAILGDGAHEQWLETNAPGWESSSEAELAPRVADKATEVEFPQVFEDTVGEMEREDDPVSDRSGMLFRDESRARPHTHDRDLAGTDGENGDPLDEETTAIIEEAKEMTRERRADDESDE